MMIIIIINSSCRCLFFWLLFFTLFHIIFIISINHDQLFANLSHIFCCLFVFFLHYSAGWVSSVLQNLKFKFFSSFHFLFSLYHELQIFQFILLLLFVSLSEFFFHTGISFYLFIPSNLNRNSLNSFFSIFKKSFPTAYLFPMKICQRRKTTTTTKIHKLKDRPPIAHFIFFIIPFSIYQYNI